MNDYNIKKYINLLTLFVTGKISAVAFEHRYLELFKNDSTIYSETLFLILDKLFGDVDAFCADSTLRDEFDLDEKQLRQACIQTLAKLEVMLAQKSFHKITVTV